ncbi:hypothetical protein KR059_008623, partial [Drosophila kikkawai]
VKLKKRKNFLILHIKKSFRALNNTIPFSSYLFSIDYKKNQSPEERLEYVSNPLSAFSLVRRTHEDLPKWNKQFQEEMELTNKVVLDELVAYIPDSQDFLEAGLGIQRIEKIYGLRIDDLAKGFLQDKQYSIRFTFRDCLAMGNLMFQQGDFLAAAKWYRMASKLEPKEDNKILKKILGDPTDYLKRQYLKALFVYGKFYILNRIIPLLITISASVFSGDSLSNDEALAKVEKKFADIDSGDIDEFYLKLTKPENDIELEKQLYEMKRSPTDFEKGCRGEFQSKSRLTCSYNHTTTPFLRLAPLKMEEISRNPYIVMYHDVLYDSEIEVLKGQSDGFNNGFADEKNGSIIRDIVARHVVLFYVSRGNHFKICYFYIVIKINVILQASDVAQGGATVFPELKISIFPRKGSAIWWYNLYNNGTTDTRSKHSVCPVIKGDR